MQLGVISIQIERDGEAETIELDLDPNHFTLKEGVRLEKALGPGAQDLFTGEEITVTFSMLQAILWAKLASTHPGIGIEDFDLDLAVLADVTLEDDAPPLTTEALERALFVDDVDPEAVAAAAAGKA